MMRCIWLLIRGHFLYLIAIQYMLILVCIHRMLPNNGRNEELLNGFCDWIVYHSLYGLWVDSHRIISHILWNAKEKNRRTPRIRTTSTQHCIATHNIRKLITFSTTTTDPIELRGGWNGAFFLYFQLRCVKSLLFNGNLFEQFKSEWIEKPLFIIITSGWMIIWP